jgi:hypothetical protein
MHTIVEIPHYSRKADKLLSEVEKNEIISYLAFHPKAGEILTGTGGIRKIRWKREGKGKSGGVRVIYYFHDENIPIFLLSLFSKGEMSNLSKAERNNLSKLTKILTRQYKV